ncbi:MAG: pyridoxamine 5'-phosphate oxidase family protein [Chloroflexota bacterium]
MVHKPLGEDKCLEILGKASVGRLGMCVGEEPYVVPLTYVWHEGKVVFHSSPNGRKMETLTANPRVCFQVDDETTIIPSPKACVFTTHYYSAMVAGEVHVVAEPMARLAAIRALVAKYDPEGKAPLLTEEDLEGQAFEVLEIVPESISGVDHARLRSDR